MDKQRLVMCFFRAILGILITIGIFTPEITAAIQEYEPDEHTIILDHLNGTTLGTPSNISYGPGLPGLGECAVIDGATYGLTTYIQYPGVDQLCIPNGTMEAWVWFDGVTTDAFAASQGPYQGSPAGWTFHLFIEYEEGPGLHVRAGAWSVWHLISSETFVLREWTHLAVTWGSRGAELWINGQLKATHTSKGHPASGFGGHLILRSNRESVVLKIDEVRISNIQRGEFPIPVEETTWGAIKTLYRLKEGN
jgi:hypothetical protein